MAETSELADFVLGFCRTHGAVVEPPAYGVHDVLLPDGLAARLGIEAFQRFAFEPATEPAAAGEYVTHLTYGHPLVEQLGALARAQPACAQFAVHGLRLDRTGLAALARAALPFPNANLVEAPHALETRALFRYVRFNFRAALVGDEKHEHLIAVLMDAQTGAVAQEFTPSEAHQLTAGPDTSAGLPRAPATWTQAPDPLAAAPLRELAERAAQASRQALAEPIAAGQSRAARLLQLDRARLEAYYAGLERDLERRLSRAEDEARRANLDGKLAATRADHTAKLADAQAKHRLRLELDLVNLAVISQPKISLLMRVENRHAAVTRPVVWDPLRHAIEALVCDVCRRPNRRLHLCAGNHLACDECLAPQCVDCKRVYCGLCAAELSACEVCHRPVCRKSLTTCRECGRGTCREHVGLCHLPAVPLTAPLAEAPPASLSAVVSHAPVGPGRRPSAPSRAGAPARPSPPRADQPRPPTDYRLQVEIRPDEPLVAAFVLTKGEVEMAQRSWRLTREGIRVVCRCEKGFKCPSAHRVLKPQPPARIDAQLEAEIERFRSEYRIPPYRAIIYAWDRGEMLRQTQLRLRGAWKDRSSRDDALPESEARVWSDPAGARDRVPDWVQAFTPAEARRFLPDIERFARIALGWLMVEGALRCDNLAALTAAAAQPAEWYVPGRALSLFKADPLFHVAQGNVIYTETVKHPLKILKEKEARGFPALSLTADELLAAAQGPAPLSPREAEIEQALNRRAPRRLYLRSIQRMFRNVDRPANVVGTIIELCAPRDADEANALASLLAELWNSTPRYELRGRTPRSVSQDLEPSG